MAGFDTSNVAATVGTGQTSPLDALGKFAGVQNELNQNRMFQGRQAAGQILQHFIKPDGTIDTAGFGQAVGQNRFAAPFAAQALQDAASLQGTNITNQTNQQALQAKQFATLQSALAQTGSDAEVPGVINRLVASGQITSDLAANAAGGNVHGLDSASIKTLRQQAIMAAGNQAELRANVGEPGQINTGGKIVSTNVKTGFGGTDVALAGGDAGSLATTMTPEAMGGFVSTVGPDGVTRSVPRSAVESSTGQPKLNVPGLTDASGAITGSLPPGAAEGRAALGQTSGQQYANELSESAGSQTRITQLKQISALLQTPEGKTGPGTQVVSGWRNFLLGNMPLVLQGYPGLTQAQVQSATQDELRKYMTQVAFAQSGAFGPNTNEKLAAASAGNANPDMSNLANQDVTRMNLALERAKQARLAAFQQSGLPAEQYSTWASNWNRHVDPRAFMLDQLSKAERQTALASIKTPAEKAAILRGKAAAEAAGLYQESDIPR